MCKRATFTEEKLAFRLNEFVLYELFLEQGKVIGSLLYSGL